MSRGISGEDLNLALKRVFDYIDTLPLEEYIERYKGTKKSIRDLMDELSEKYPYEDTKYKIDGLFDVVAEDEFIDFLEKKFNLKIYEKVTIENYIR